MKICDATICNAVSAAFREAGSTKQVARLTGKSPQMVGRYQRGESEPPAGVVFRLMARSRKAADTILMALGLTDEAMNAREAELLRELIELRIKRRGDAEKTGAVDRVADRADGVAAGALAVSRMMRP